MRTQMIRREDYYDLRLKLGNRTVQLGTINRNPNGYWYWCFSTSYSDHWKGQAPWDIHEAIRAGTAQAVRQAVERQLWVALVGELEWTNVKGGE